MSQVVEILADWYHHSRLLYAFVTLGTVVGLGVFVGLLSAWLARKLGLDASQLKHR